MMKLSPSTILIFSYLLFQSSITKTNLITNCNNRNITNTVQDLGKYNVISFTSFNSNNVPKQVARFHLKLRYIIGRQQKINRYMKIGFVNYNICKEKYFLTERLIEILTKKEFNPYGDILQNNGSCCKLCRCINYDPSTIITIISYLPPDLTTLTASILSGTVLPLFAHHPEMSLLLGSKARQRVIDRYTLKGNVTKLEQLYRKLCNYQLHCSSTQ